MEPSAKKYGTISPVPSTDTLIYECFALHSEETQRKFVKKFKTEDDRQVNHTLRELVLGTYIVKQGFTSEYEPKLGGKTPEWLMTQTATGKQLLVELVNFHLPDKTEEEMWAAFKTGWIWTHWAEPNVDRTYHSLWEKMRTYKALADDNDLPYVVGIFGLFSANMTFEEVKQCVEGEDSLFKLYPEVSGVLYFQHLDSEYIFRYLPNPDAKRTITLADGTLPTPSPH